MMDWWPLLQGLIDLAAMASFLWAYSLVYRWWFR